MFVQNSAVPGIGDPLSIRTIWFKIHVKKLETRKYSIRVGYSVDCVVLTGAIVLFHAAGSSGPGSSVS
jgi:hypothetical protein